jgi:AhpD family alkylhydroperoxidase
MGSVLTRATLRGTRAQVRHITPVHPTDAQGLTARVYQQVQRDLGMLAPPITLHSPAPGALAASWLILRESLVASGRAGRTVKEAVATAVSLSNACPYCVDVHSTALRGLVRARAAAAIAQGRLDAVPDPGLRAVARWARDAGTRAVAGGHPVPVPANQVPELVAVAVAFQYLNRMVNIFLVESPIPGTVPAFLRGGIQQVIGWTLAPTAWRVRAPGASLPLLPPAHLPASLAWAGGHEVIGDALARAAAAVDVAGVRSVPPAVRDLVLSRLATWDGRPPRSGGLEVEDALPAGDRAAGRLALLAAFASYRTSPPVIAEFRARYPDDRTLVEAASWASLAAAVRIGGWMHAGATAGRPVAAPAEE